MNKEIDQITEKIVRLRIWGGFFWGVLAGGWFITILYALLGAFK